MRVRRITSSGDWTFGHGRADYAQRSEAIRQNVVTRLRSFTNDWFLDVTHGEEWLDILGQRVNEGTLLGTVERCVLLTTGVVRINRLRIVSVSDRNAVIDLKFIDIFDQEFSEQVSVP